jgi:beta-glucosidase-like glycosyl hydrolase
VLSGWCRSCRGIKALGFNWNFAPVLDLNNNVDNPVIAERSFGADPQRASTLALAWMDGSLSEGVACCVKHFPGHGDTNVDSTARCRLSINRWPNCRQWSSRHSRSLSAATHRR